MDTTINAGEPPYTTAYTTADTTGDTEVNISHSFGFFFLVLFFFIILCYGTYIYNIRHRSRPPPPRQATRSTTALDTATNHHHTDNHTTRFSQGLDDDILVTFPTFVYSDDMTNNSGCSVCLSDYKPADVVRLLPECGHLFHVSCVDTWLKVHPTCPVCRSSPLSSMV